jgi:glutathione-specific gamma-glutamylcyclotransferase
MSESRWVFGYGSLIWRPGFPFVQSEPARLEGWHRSLCVLSHIYRGTPDCLGLVFGLDEGGYCDGVAFEVAAVDWPQTYTYLTDRELVTTIYREAKLPVLLASGRTVEALTYVVDRDHPQYAGLKTTAEILDHVRQGQGQAGSCVDYVTSTAQHLAALGIPDGDLDALVALL